MSKQVLCDYCGISKEPKTIFSAQKSFVGYKMIDVLQTVTHKDLPANLALKVCLICASTLITTLGVIEKTQKLVDNASAAKSASATGKNKKAAIQKEEPDKSITDPIVDLTAEAEAEKSAKPKNQTIRQRSKSMAARPSDLIFPKSPANKLDELNASPAKKLDKLNASPSKKTPKKNTTLLEDDLDDSVRLTPAKEVAPIKKTFFQLFGSRNGDAAAAESEDEDEDEDENIVIAMKQGFDCKLCDFQARTAKPFKEHLTQVHGQQRPRIYTCDLCPKTFGILKSWRTHLETVHGATVEAKGKEAPKEAKGKEAPKEAKGKEPPKEAKGKEPPKEAKAKEAKGKVAKVAKEQQQQQIKDSQEEEMKPTAKSPQKEPKTIKANEKSPQKEPKANKTNEKSPQKELKSNKANEKSPQKKFKANETSEAPSEGPILATIKALNGEAAAKKKWLDKVINNNQDLSFDVSGSSASTPKAGAVADNSIELHNEYKCDICDSELATAKQMQEHMKTAHGIDKPKVFKCHICDKALTTKVTLKHHMNLHSVGAEAEKSSKRKILQEEKEVDSVDAPPSQEDDEEPQEEKIRHTEERETDSLSPNIAEENGLMAPPKKKPKKVKDSSSQDNSPVISISESPSKKAKRKNKDNTSMNETTTTTVDLLDEINTNVKPHKKARLESISDSLSSTIDDYSTAEEPLLSCGQCGKQVKSKQRLSMHIRNRHGTKLECPDCQTSYSNQRDYVNHFAVCSGGGNLLPCGVGKCKKSFVEGNYLSSHLRLKHQWV